MHQPADLRKLNGRRPDSAPIAELCTPAQLQPDLLKVIEPIQRSFGRPQVVTREHTNNAVRWKEGERLNHLLEESCIRFAGK